MVNQLTAGSVLGDYEIIKSLGHGGMAEVFLAKQSGISGFQRLVALKVIHPTHSDDKAFIDALIQEAKVAVQLSHPNIGQVHDLGKLGDVYFIVMDFIDGKDLYRLLFESSHQSRQIPTPIALFIAERVAAGLGYCHERKDHYGRPMNLVHRDVSPQNIFLSWHGDIKILDFGIAKVSHRLRHTEAGVIKGKLQYMSPEQISGQELDARSDLFSCAICLYEMLSGEMARADEDPLELLDKIKRAEFRSLAAIRPDLDVRIVNLVERALSVNPVDRIASGDQLSIELQRLRFELFPQFRASVLGDFMVALFDGQPFYLEDSTVGPAHGFDDEFDQSISLSSSVIFGDEKTELVARTDEHSMIGEDTLNLNADEVESEHDSDTFVGGNPHHYHSGDDSGLHGSSMEKTNLFAAPRLDRAVPFVDPSTSSGFADLSPGVRAGPSSKKIAGARGDVSNEFLKADRAAEEAALSGSANGLMSNCDSADDVAPTRAQKEKSNAVKNPFDASVETRGQRVNSKQRRMDTLFRSMNRTGKKTGRSLATRITFWVLGILLGYFSLFVLPSLLGGSTTTMSSVYLMSEPAGAQIYINGQDSRKLTNVELSVPTKSDSVFLITLNGYRATEITIDVATKEKADPGVRIERRIRLEPQ
jgi:serine/threonine protein kinase